MHRKGNKSIVRMESQNVDCVRNTWLLEYGYSKLNIQIGDAKELSDIYLRSQTHPMLCTPCDQSH